MCDRRSLRGNGDGNGRIQSLPIGDCKSVEQHRREHRFTSRPSESSGKPLRLRGGGRFANYAKQEMGDDYQNHLSYWRACKAASNEGRELRPDDTTQPEKVAHAQWKNLYNHYKKNTPGPSSPQEIASDDALDIPDSHGKDIKPMEQVQQELKSRADEIKSLFSRYAKINGIANSKTIDGLFDKMEEWSNDIHLCEVTIANSGIQNDKAIERIDKTNQVYTTAKNLIENSIAPHE